MDDFSAADHVNPFGVPSDNLVEPGKMPQSSTCPTIVLDAAGNVVFLGGAAGGKRITTATSFVSDLASRWYNFDVKIKVR